MIQIRKLTKEVKIIVTEGSINWYCIVHYNENEMIKIMYNKLAFEGCYVQLAMESITNDLMYFYNIHFKEKQRIKDFLKNKYFDNK